MKRAYRARIVATRPDVRFVYPKGSEDLITGRVNVRHHEYMPASLLHSQFETLEPPMPGEPVIAVDAGDLPEVEVQKIIDALGPSRLAGGARNELLTAMRRLAHADLARSTALVEKRPPPPLWQTFGAAQPTSYTKTL